MKRASIILLVILLAGSTGWAQENYGIQKVGSVYNCWSGLHGIASKNASLLVNTGLSGLQVLDIHDPSNAEIVYNYNGYWSSEFIIDGEKLYTMTSDSVCVYDVSDVLDIHQLGSYSSLNTRDFTVSEGIVYLHHIVNEGREYFHTLSIVDFNDPANAQLIGSMREVNTRKMLVQGNLLYCESTANDPGHFQRFTIFDISDPEDIILLDQSDRIDWIESIQVNNGLAYVVESNSVLTIFDVSNPSDIQTVSVINNLGLIRKICVREDWIFTVGDIVASINISDPENPTVVDSVENVENQYLLYATLTENTLAVSNYSHPRLSLIDVSDPSNMVVVYERKTPLCVLNVLLEGDRAYVLFYKGGLGILEVSNPSEPEILSCLDFPQDNQYYIRLIRKDHWIFCPFWNSDTRTGGLNIINVSDPRSPEIVSSDTLGKVNNAALKDDHLFLANTGDGIRILDVHDPENYQQVALLNLAGSTLNLIIEENYLYIRQYNMANHNEYKLITFDITNPMQPQECSRVDLPPTISASHFLINSQILYLIRTGVIMRFSLADPAHPSLIENRGLGGERFRGFATVNDDILITGGDRLNVYSTIDELGQYQEPTQIGSYDNPGNCYNLAVQGNLLFVADETNLGIYDISEAIGWQSVGQSEANSPVEWELLSVYPNPFNSAFRLELSVTKPGMAAVSLFDISGRKISTIDSRYFNLGIQSLNSDQIHLPTGHYLLEIKSEGWSKSIPITCIK